MTDSTPAPWDLLARGVGRFEGPETMAPAPWAPDGMSATGTAVGHLILGGRAIASDHVQRVDGAVTLESHTVIRYDANEGEFVMHFFAGGAPMELRGRRDGSALVLEGDGPGGPMRQTLRYGEAELAVVSEGQDPETGEWSTTFEGTYRRVDGSPAD